MHESEAEAAYRRPANPRVSRHAPNDANTANDEEFRKSYAARANIESTHAQAIRRSGLRRARYRGLTTTHLQHVVTAVAINLLRIAAWASGTPIAQTHCSQFAALQFRSI